MRDIIADSLIISMSASFLWHFSNIWHYGQQLIQEPNMVVKSLETAGLPFILAVGIYLFILAFGIYKIVYDVRRYGK